MFDFKFDWKEELSIGIDEIDEQHKEMFRIIRDMEQLLITRCIGVRPEQLYDIITQLREFVSYHFYHEEVLMKKYEYSKLEEHTQIHQNLFRYVLEIDLPALGRNPYEELKKIKDGIQDWIFEHMFRDDKEMGLEIVKKINEQK